MIFLIDIGNSRIKIGGCENPNLKDAIKTYYCDKLSTISSILSKAAKNIKSIDSVIISSVVPELNQEIKKIISQKFKLDPIFISTDLKTGIKFSYSPVSDLGPDRIADSVAAHNNYQKGKYKIVVDFGTATVFEVISEKGEFLGGSIFPGLEIASKALSLKASLLNEIDFDKWDDSQKVIGNTTNEALKSSIYWGYISLTDGIVKKIIDELELNRSECIIIGTGGFANIINNQISIFDKIDQNLTLEGMRIIYNMNLNDEYFKK